MTLRFYIFILVVSGIFVNGCKKSRDMEEQRYTWSTEAPLTIPYRIRLQRFEKGNMVRNSSFETGRTFTLDTSTTSYVIDGWQQVGQHVQWIDTRNDSLAAHNEAFSGYRSVKIVRKDAYETDEQGDGIMSEFIKVIPGNYALSFYTKLENIYPARARLGIKMYDAVNVSLLYYDRNKIAISPKQRFPENDQFINTSFKSLSLANYSHIPFFGWGKIIGKSEYFPFPEGDIPSEAHYVRIFIGLKGKGTMWIDSVSFSYSDRNFSVNERMKAYTDTAFSLIEAIIPTPKKYSKLESVVFQSPAMDPEQQPLIIIPFQADALVVKSARLLQSALRISETRIVRESKTLQIEEPKLVFNLGKTGLYKRFHARLPDQDIRQHPQGYYIHSPGDMPNLVFLEGNNSTGIYYAALTVIQMIDKKQPVYHNARIIDFPDFADRFCALKNLPDDKTSQRDDFTEELKRYKFNGAFLEGDANLGFFMPLSQDERFTVKRIPKYEAPSDSTLTYIYPSETTIPFAFHNQLLDYSGFDDTPVRKNEVTGNLYAGSSYFSINTDDADIDRYMAHCGTKPVFMDNSMQISTSEGHYAGNDPWYPGKIRLYNIFEPFNNEAIREHFSKLDTTMFFVNMSAGSEIDVIRLATAADFIWNTPAYSKDLSLWKVLQSRYGAEISRELINYADQYGMMLEMLLRMKMTRQVPRNLKTEQQTLAGLNSTVIKITKGLGSDHQLVKELTMLNSELRNKLTGLSANAKVVD
jgi:hypothetical protein